MIEFRLDWCLFIALGICIGGLIFYSPKPKLDTVRLSYRIDHALDILQDLQELAQNIHIKDATDNFTQERVPQDLSFCPVGTDLFVVAQILECKSKQMFDILHPVLCELKKER